MMRFRKDLRNKLEDQAFIFEKLFGNACLVNPHLQLSHFISNFLFFISLILLSTLIRMDHARIKNINMRKKNGKEMKNGTVLERELSGFG